jgi:hypothetical protein
MRYESALRYTAQYWPNLAGWIERKVGKHNKYNFSKRGRVNHDLLVVGLGKNRRQLVQSLILVWIALGRDKNKNTKSYYFTAQELHKACKDLKQRLDQTYSPKYSDKYIRDFLNDYNTKVSKYSKPVFQARPKLILKGKVNNKYEKIKGAMDKLPTHYQWRTYMAKPSIRAGCPVRILNYIDNCLTDYGAVKAYNAAAGWDRLAALGNLYFSCTAFLSAEKNRCPPLAGRNYPNSPIGLNVWKLFITVLDELCRTFNCKVNFLPQRLEECFGRILTPHGANIDIRPNVAHYITREKKRDFFRLIFRGGLAYMRKRKHPFNWVRADSRGMGGVQPKAVDKKYGKMMYKGHAGFALSMSRKIYMTRHRGSFPSKNFFHSSYLAGAAILCSGTIKIEMGRIKEITDASGHYRPTPYHMVNLLETLKMHGVNLGAIRVSCTCWLPDIYTGKQIITWRRGGLGLKNRIAENRIQVSEREGRFPLMPMKRWPRKI